MLLDSENNIYIEWVDLNPANPLNVDLWYYYWANDTLGNWRKTPIDFWRINVILYYPPITTTSNTLTNSTNSSTNEDMVPIEFAVSVSVILIGCILVVIIKKKP